MASGRQRSVDVPQSVVVAGLVSFQLVWGQRITHSIAVIMGGWS